MTDEPVIQDPNVEPPGYMPPTSAEGIVDAPAVMYNRYLPAEGLDRLVLEAARDPDLHRAPIVGHLIRLPGFDDDDGGPSCGR